MARKASGENEASPKEKKISGSLIEGLFDHLPPPGSVWPEAQRKAWFDAAAANFKLTYKDEAPPE